MKIAFDAKRLYCNFTGLGNHSRTTLDILTQYYPDNEYLLYTPKVKHNDITDRYLNSDQLQTVMPSGLMKGGVWRTFSLAGEARKAGADIFHGLSNELPVGIEGSGVPSVVTIHDVAFKTFTDMYHWQDRQIYDLKWRYAIRHADHIIAISECTKRDILRFYDVPEEKISVVYQPVSPEYYSPSIHPSPSSMEPYALYVGSINSRKNLLGAVKALELLPESVRIPLYIVGNGREYKREVEAYIESHGLGKWCVWLKDVYSDELRQLYVGARFFIYPSYYEGFGLPVVEARLSGCPVITSNLSSLPEAAGSHALLIDPADPRSISQAMDRLITDDALHHDLSVRSREEAMQTLHPQVLAGQLMDVYKKVIE